MRRRDIVITAVREVNELARCIRAFMQEHATDPHKYHGGTHACDCSSCCWGRRLIGHQVWEVPRAELAAEIACEADDEADETWK